ncbi:MAG: hypothetical protein QM781_18610 [Chitinophagaceae bacterium]
MNRFRTLLLLLFVLATATTRAQWVSSIATDFSVQRNFASQQRYWSIGQTIKGEWHMDALNTGYAWFSYYNKGKFTNNLTATAKDPATSPSGIDYRNRGGISFSQLSFGWKRYIAGNAFAEEGLNVYGLAGLGLLFGKVLNTHNTRIDTALYNAPVLAGRAKFNRLTLDLGLGVEVPVGGDFFVYGECKSYIPVSTFPNRYLLNDKYTPLPGMLTIGVRVLFQ